MDNKFNKYLSYDFQKKLIEHKIIDSFQFLNSAYFKLDSSLISINALDNLFLDKLDNINSNGFINKSDYINYLGVKTSRLTLQNKLFNEIYSNFHSFFDVLAQFINCAYLADDGYNLEKISFNFLCNQINNSKEITNNFLLNLPSVRNNEEYKYIEDINNTLKHRFQLFLNSSYDLISKTYNLQIPSFDKTQSYSSYELINQCRKSFTFCLNLLYNSANSLELMLSSKCTPNVSSRIYNPNFKVFYNSQSDKNANNPVCFYPYIELSNCKIITEYNVMFAKYIDKYEWIITEKCDYEIIVVVNGLGEQIGILKLQSTSNNTSSLLFFNKYIFIDKNYIDDLNNFAYNLSNFRVTSISNCVEIIGLPS